MLTYSSTQSHNIPRVFFYTKLNFIHHVKIRMGCSKLNQHPFHNHLIENPSFVCGNPAYEPSHFCLNCLGYAAIRIELANNVGLFQE